MSVTDAVYMRGSTGVQLFPWMNELHTLKWVWNDFGTAMCYFITWRREFLHLE